MKNISITPWTPSIYPLRAIISSVQFSRSVVSDFCYPMNRSQASLSIINSRSLLRLMSIESVMPSNHLILCRPLQSFPALGSFQMSQFFTSGGECIGVSPSASVLPMITQDWFPLGWTGWTSLQAKGFSRVFSSTTVQKHQFFGTALSFLHSPTLTSIHGYFKLI